jgi:hypothetical protein
VLESDKPVWAVAVPVTTCYLGDAELGAVVHGHAFVRDAHFANLTEAVETEPVRAPMNLPPGDYGQGFDQSPQRSR